MQQTPQCLDLNDMLRPLTQAPNVSLQQLIASFAAQSRQLGVPAAPRKNETSVSHAAMRPDLANNSTLSDVDQLTSCRCTYASVKQGQC